MKHVILGAGGAIGNALAYELLEQKQEVRLFSRSGYAIDGTESQSGNLMSIDDTERALSGCDIAHLCVGLPYQYEVWRKQWPVIMRNTIEACKKQNVKLVFFDNVYMYGKVSGKMTEETPYNPCSKKGEVRAEVARMLEQEMQAGNLKAVIARASDIYGPYGGQNSMPYLMVFEKMLQGKKPQWMFDARKTHSFTYIPDIARGMRMLADCDECYGQVWHLPTYNPAPDGETFIALAARNLGVNPDYSVLKMWMIKMVALFNKTVKELPEMAYQMQEDFYVDSTKFENYFNYQPKAYDEGIKETIEYLRRKISDT